MKANKFFIVLLSISLSSTALANPPAGYCEVLVCNKLERFTLDVWKHIRDAAGEQCFNTIVDKAEAVEGKILDSSTRWYQGNLNITKRSVTRVKKVISCTPVATPD